MNATAQATYRSAVKFSYLVAIVAILPAVEAGEKDGRFTVRCLNKESVVRPDPDGKVNIQLEVTLNLRQELQLKPGDVRLAILDAQLKQLDELVSVVPPDWTKKSFKKGMHKETLTLQFPGLGDINAGREYYVAIMFTGPGEEGVFPASLRLVKFKVAQ